VVEADRRLVDRRNLRGTVGYYWPQAPVSPKISIDRKAVSAFCRRHHIARLALFGSVLRDDFRPDSDIDVPVERPSPSGDCY
jgi:hypothetical protein